MDHTRGEPDDRNEAEEPNDGGEAVQGNATTAPLYANIVTIARPSRPRYGRAYRTSRTNVRQ